MYLLTSKRWGWREINRLTEYMYCYHFKCKLFSSERTRTSVRRSCHNFNFHVILVSDAFCLLSFSRTQFRDGDDLLVVSYYY